MAAPAFGVLITYLDRSNEIAALGHDLGVRIVQLHGDISRNEPNTLKAPDPGLPSSKFCSSDRTRTKLSKRCWASYPPFVDAFIADTLIQKPAHRAPQARLMTGA